MKKFVGDTPLKHNPTLADIYEHQRLYIKDESANPSGTWKDRRSKEALESAQKSHRRHLCLISAGNGALSVAKLAEGTNIRVTAVLGDHIKPHIFEHLEKAGIRLVHTKLDRQLSCKQIQDLAKANEEDNPLDITNFFHMAYRRLLIEIDQTGLDPDVIVAPYGTGEALFGLALENLSRLRDQRKPLIKLIGVKPAVTPSFADKLTGKFGPYPQYLEDHRNQVSTVEVSEDEIIQAQEKVSPHLSIEPSAAAAFAALPKLNLRPDDNVVVINSGRGIF